jgi:hypothetical protein
MTVIEVKVEERIPQAGGTARRSDPVASAAHRRLGTSYCARDPSRNQRPKRRNCSQGSWQNERSCLRVKVVEL